MMDDKKELICPLLSLVTAKDSNVDWVYCKRTSCAWFWDDRCAVVSIGRQIFDINYSRGNRELQ